MSFFKVTSGSTGNFLCPPGDPGYKYELHEYSGPSGRKVQGTYHLGWALDRPDVVGESVHRRVKDLYDKADLVMSDLWVRHVYGYFKNSYAPEDGDRNVSRSVRTGPPERHLGYLLIKKYFPEAEPRLDLIEDPGNGYGSFECGKCHERVQYEAKFDAWTRVVNNMKWGYYPTCTDGGKHEPIA